jgi:hypothetical protein
MYGVPNMLNTTPTAAEPTACHDSKPYADFDPDKRLHQIIQVTGLLDAAFNLHLDGAKENEAGNALACTIDQARIEFRRPNDILTKAGHEELRTRDTITPDLTPAAAAAAEIVALINSRPQSPREDEIETIIAGIAGVGTPKSRSTPDLLLRVREAIARADAATEAMSSLLDGPEFDAALAEVERWEDEVEALEEQIPSPPRCLEDLMVRAEIARFGGETDREGRFVEAENGDIFTGPAARLVEAVLQFVEAGDLSCSGAPHVPEPRTPLAEKIRSSTDGEAPPCL